MMRDRVAQGMRTAHALAISALQDEVLAADVALQHDSYDEYVENRCRDSVSGLGHFVDCEQADWID